MSGSTPPPTTIIMKMPLAAAVYLPRPSVARLNTHDHITEVQRPHSTSSKALRGTVSISNPLPLNTGMEVWVSLLTNKPIIYAANLSDTDFQDGSADANPYFAAVKEIAASEHAGVLPICAELEAEMAGMEPEEKELFLSEMGLSQSGLDRLINACYDLLGLISYLTAGKPEVRAWTITKGTKAPQAAGKIHTDFERGFIRAEVVAFDDLMACGSMAAAKEKGLVRSEGKDYVMKDGDIVLFRFNV